MYPPLSSALNAELVFNAVFTANTESITAADEIKDIVFFIIMPVLL